MTWKKLLGKMFVVVFVMAVGVSSVVGADRPNVLFLAIDDLNDWIGVMGGHPQAQTPHMDKVANEGVLFMNAQCQAPICNPSRISLISGLLPSTTGVYFMSPRYRDDDSPVKDGQSMFDYFHANGYETLTRGKIFHASDSKNENFDVYSQASNGVRPKGKLAKGMDDLVKAWDWGVHFESDDELRDYRTAVWAADQLKELKAKKGKPFFMAVGFSLPHVPLYAPQKWFDLYPLDSVFVPDYLDTDMDDISEYAKQLTFGGVAPRQKMVVETGQWPQAVRSYLACISFVDMCVGVVTDELEKQGLADNTIVVVFSDHGFHLGEKDRWAKRSLWEESARVPMMITAPGMERGAVSNKPVGLIDLYPTLVDLCGLPQKKGLDGVSIKPLLVDANDADWVRPAITTHGPNNHSVRSERYRYITYDDGSEELYDHNKDPHELRNLVAENRDRYAKIIDAHVKWLPKVNVPLHPRSGGSDSPVYGEGTKEQSKLVK